MTKVGDEVSWSLDDTMMVGRGGREYGRVVELEGEWMTIEYGAYLDRMRVQVDDPRVRLERRQLPCGRLEAIVPSKGD